MHCRGGGGALSLASIDNGDAITSITVVRVERCVCCLADALSAWPVLARFVGLICGIRCMRLCMACLAKGKSSLVSGCRAVALHGGMSRIRR